MLQKTVEFSLKCHVKNKKIVSFFHEMFIQFCSIIPYILMTDLIYMVCFIAE